MTLFRFSLIMILLISIFIPCNSNTSVDPDQYYRDAAGLQGKELKAALHRIIRGHRVYPYFADKTNDDEIAVADILMHLDEDPENPDNLILFYTGRSQNKLFLDHGQDFDYLNEYGIDFDDSWNREHLWPKSHGFPSMQDTAYSDVHNLRPADRSVNGMKGSKDFDTGGFPVPEAFQTYTDYNSWEPRPQIRGDIARSLFYMAVRYEIGRGDLELMDKTGTYEARIGHLSTLLRWHAQDPPDEREKHRNDIIYSEYQGNRNPFIDHPKFASLIWGEPSTSPRIEWSEELIVFPAVTANSGQPIAHTVAFAGENLIGSQSIFAGSGFETTNLQMRTGIVLPDGQIQPNNGRITGVVDVLFTPSDETLYRDVCGIRSADGAEYGFSLTGRGKSKWEKVLLSESFEEGKPGPKWKIISRSSDKDWHRSSYGGRYFMKINGYHRDDNTPSDDWLILPEISLRESMGGYLSFFTAKNHRDDIPGLECLISTDYHPQKHRDPALATWTVLPADLSDGHYQWVWSSPLDLSPWAGEKIHIAFRYRCTSGNKATAWELDDITVSRIAN